MADLADKLSKDVKSRIMADMRPRPLTILWKSGLAVLAGGLLSLLACGQFGVGITHAALHFNQELHTHGTSIGSALLCGIAFALIPPFFLRLFCSSLQFRFIIRKSPAFAMVWLVGLGAVLAHHGQTAVELAVFVLWATASVTTFVAVARFIDRFAQGLSFPSEKAI